MRKNLKVFKIYLFIHFNVSISFIHLITFIFTSSAISNMEIMRAVAMLCNECRLLSGIDRVWNQVIPQYKNTLKFGV